MSNELDLFASAGDGLSSEHFGIDEHGRAFVVASVFAKAMGYRDATNATRILDAAEVGTQHVSTSESSGRVANRPVSVIYEDGIWELIFRSTLPSARSIKARVKAILRELRETGVVDTRPSAAELSRRELAEMVIAEADRADMAEAAIAILAPAASAWETFCQTGATLTVGEAAKFLIQNTDTETGRTRLYAMLRDLGWVFKQSREPVGDAVRAGYVVVEGGKPYLVEKTNETRTGSARTRLTGAGLIKLAQHLGIALDTDAVLRAVSGQGEVSA